MTTKICIALVLASFLLQFSCSHDNPLPRSPEEAGYPEDSGSGEVSNPADGSSGNYGGLSCDSDSVYFENQILPIFIASCAVTGCHDAGTHADDITLLNYNDIMRGIKPGDPRESKYFKVLTLTDTDDLMPIDPQTGEGFRLPEDQLALIEEWIIQNAPNNVCNDCDSTVFNFSGPVQAILGTSCASSIGCHASGSNYGQFTSYAEMKPYIDNGSMMDRVVVKQDMPVAAPLPACDVIILRKWLEAGGPNNQAN